MLCKRLWALLLAVMTLAPAAVAAAETATITAEGVNLRQQADTESNALRTLARQPGAGAGPGRGVVPGIAAG